MRCCSPGTDEGGAGSSASVGFGARVAAALKGRKASADRIVVEGVDDECLQSAAKATYGFSGEPPFLLCYELEPGCFKFKN